MQTYQLFLFSLFMKLKNKIAIITGGATGIGKATSLLFAKEGAKVIIASRNEKNGDNIVREIKKKKGQAEFIKTDVSKENDIKSLILNVIKKYKKIDILFNNAGIESSTNVIDTELEDWENMIHTNLRSVYLCSKYSIPHMKKGSVIVNTASVAGLVGFLNLASYCAAKGGVVNLTKQMALDYAMKGIRVNCVCPGAIDTPMIRRYIKNAPNPKQAKKDLRDMHPMGRMGKPEEIASTVLFLSSGGSSFITGQAIAIDGGFVAR